VKKKLAIKGKLVYLYIMTNIKKTFSDLVFESHANVADAVQARLDLGNDFEISVVSMNNGGHGLYGNASAGTYEVAVFHNDEMAPLAKYDNVIGWQDADLITRLMTEVQVNGLAWLTLLKEIRNDFTASLVSNH
jgi:hypothetical protein